MIPYLSHNLICQTSDGETDELLGLEKEFEGEQWFGLFDEFDTMPLTDFKPLLIPLSELLDELAEWLEKEMLAFIKNKKVILINKEWCITTLTEYFKEPQQNPYYICQKIFELHGDLFNLIPQKLALNKLEHEK